MVGPRLISRAAVAITLIAGAAVAPLAAQEPDPQCLGPIAGDACQRAIDLFNYMAPQLGTLIAGGNAALGQAGVLGGLGHFTIGMRANLTREFHIPSFDDQDLDTGPVRQGSFRTERSVAGFPVVDGAFGIFAGLPLGITRVGGVDALINVFYVPGQLLPDGGDGDLAVRLPDGDFDLGWGLRVGLLGETPLTPAVSVTYIRRGLPPLDLEMNSIVPGSAYSDSLSLHGLSLKTSAWRIVAGKKLAILSIAAGYGKDRYVSEGTIGIVVEDDIIRASDSLDFASTTTASNLFLDLTLSLGGIHIGGEIGRVKRSGVSTYNTFDVPADEGVGYAALGIRIGR